MDSILSYERSEEDDLYTILGCDERSTVEQIITEYKMRVLHCHPDKHPDDPAAAERFSRLQRAKCVLTEPEERNKYDTWRRAGICMPYEQWKALRDNVHMSMHWAMTRQTDPMLEGGPNTSTDEQDGTRTNHADHPVDRQHNQASDNIRWQREAPCESLRRFRNYEI